jgi:peptidoglycan/xylan/chitin deacetylase (PgdA/CDA1 family)
MRDIELAASKGALESPLDHSVVDFCYPSGDYNSNVVAAVSRAGYLTGTTEVPGTEHSWTDRLTWTRVKVNGGETLVHFVANLGQPEPTMGSSLAPIPIPDASTTLRL